MLTSLIWKPLGRAIFNAAVDWLKDPKNRAEAEKAADWVLGKVTAATPWKWDEQLVKAVKNSPLGGLLGGGGR